MKTIEKIEYIRKKMSEYNLDSYMVIDSDNHFSEYVNSYYKERSFVTEFYGEGILLVLKDKAYQFTDGRYTLQAQNELDKDIFTLIVYKDKITDSIKEILLKENVKTIGLNGERFSTSLVESFKEVSTVYSNYDFIKDIYKDRSLVFTDIFNIENLCKYTYLEKIQKVRDMLESKSLILSDLTDISWLFNLRGKDVPTSLVFLSFAYISSKEVHLFLNKNSLKEELKGVVVHEYNDFVNFISSIKGENILIDKEKLNYLYYEILNKNNNVFSDYTPATILKEHKDDVEIANSRDIHIADGLAVFKLMKYVKETKGLDELKVCDKVYEFRSMDKRFIGISFETIAGFNSNGAIVHYEPSKDTNLNIENRGILLVDSGGQYMGGTTDITRTFSIGEPTLEEKEAYTLVLKGHVDVSMSSFDKPTLGKDIDLISRSNFFNKGLDYKHGTGHGVGYMNSVHEGPFRVSYYGAKTDKYSYLEEGIVTSIEPGLYLENKFGIRIENEIYCYKENDILKYETITYCPYDRSLIIKEMLNDEEIKWINDYHKMVFNKLSPLCDNSLNEYLKECCEEL